MCEVERFDLLTQEQGYVFLRVSTRKKLVLGDNALFVDIAGKSPRFYVKPCWEQISVPEVGNWYAVSLRQIDSQIRFADLMEYYVDTAPGFVFRFGFSCTLSYRVAHIIGFQRIMKGYENANIEKMLTPIRDRMREKVMAVLAGMFGTKPREYSQLISVIDAITDNLNSSLFPLLFEYGLCMNPGSLRVTNIARPMIVI